ncbi:hypothetical protein ACIQZO_32765 [Streptomyces sp. NPDC097617]|uniref:hypothetical protein n=1 Tax=Streptomyces sp. NPDC097617 TaxID=3366091 RepID=UPI00381916E7
MTSLFERLDTEEAIVRGELSTLREKIATAEERLAHLTITRETLRSLTGHADTADDSDEPQPQEQGSAGGEDPVDASASEAPPDDVADPGGPPVSSGPLALAVARERMLVLLAGAGRAMKAQDIAAAIGEDVSDTSNGRRTETTRSRLKALVREGRVVEDPTAWFAIAPTTGSNVGDGVAMA